MKSLQAGGTVCAKAWRQECGTAGSKICEEVNVVGRGRKQDSSESCRHTGTGEAAHKGLPRQMAGFGCDNKQDKALEGSEEGHCTLSCVFNRLVLSNV